MENKTVVFDLDDTLVKEIDYLKSAYKEIVLNIDSGNGNLYHVMLNLYYKKEDVFRFLESKYSEISKPYLLNLYRNHKPAIKLNEDTLGLLKWCRSKNFTTGLITDGRSSQQNNKLDALGIKHFFDKIIISEEFGFSKPSTEVYNEFENFKGQKFYIGDNTSKDFVAPNALGWTSICLLDDGKNIHKQNFDLASEYLPQYKVNTLEEIKNIITNKTLLQ